MALKRSAPLRRTAWIRKEQPRVEREERVRQPLQPLTRLPNYASPANDALVAVPKGEKARPGKGAPTKEERAWMDAITRLGCICCLLDGVEPRPTTVHHILRGGVRMGHLYSLPACDPGHHQGGQPLGLISRHPYKARFEERYGTEAQLLELVKRLVGTTIAGSETMSVAAQTQRLNAELAEYRANFGLVVSAPGGTFGPVK